MMKRLLVILLLLFPVLSRAQEGQVRLNIKGGNNSAWGNFAAFSAECSYSLKKYFSIEGGLQYGTSGAIATEIRPSYFHDFDKGRLHGELLLHYNPYGSIHNVAAGVGAGFTARYVFARLGYYYRVFASGKDSFCEPFNIYYELGVSCLPKIPRWDLRVSVSNCRHFELERHYQPALYIDGWWYPVSSVGISVGAAYKPSGMFHVSSDYYQFYGSIGACYRW